MKIFFLIICSLVTSCLCELKLLGKIGPVKINLKSIHSCKNSKDNKTSSYEFGTMKNSFTGLSDILTVNYTLFHDAGPVQMQYKMADWNFKKNRFERPMIINGGNVCFCTMCKETFKRFADFKEPYKACNVKKGMKFVKANLTQLTHQWFGVNGFYRTIKNRAKLFTPKEILICGIAVMEVLPA